MKTQTLKKFRRPLGRSLLFAAALAITALTANAQTFTATEAVADGCFAGGPSGHLLFLPAIDPARPGTTGVNDGYKFVVTSPGTFTQFMNGSAKLTASVKNSLAPSVGAFGWDLDINFVGRQIPGTKVFELMTGCYVPGPPGPNPIINPVPPGGPVNTATWEHYASFTGTLTGTGNFAGAIVNVTWTMHEFQFGLAPMSGAAGKNVNPGAAGWFTWVVVQQPTNGPALVHSSQVGPMWFGDLNFNLTPSTVCTGRIGDFVWRDDNSNGCQDANEPGISGVVVNLFQNCPGPGGTPFMTTVTDNNGKYIFENLCAGSYTVSFVTPNGFTRTLANQGCNIPGFPADSKDSDCDCSGPTCGVCVTLTANNPEDLTIDCGYVGPLPCVTLVKTAASMTAPPGGLMTYTYVITNCGGTVLTDLRIVDDAGTPNDTSDDFIVATGITLNPGQSQTFTKTVILPTPLCAPTGSPPANVGTLTAVVLPNGDVQATFRQSRLINENVYGAPAQATWSGGHSFGNLTGSDKAEFRFTNGSGAVVLDFYLDYISAATSRTFPGCGTVLYPAGYGTLGANGGDGSLVSGNIAHVLCATTSLTGNLNSPLNGCCPSPYLVNSPTPEASFPNWNYVNSYTATVSAAAFGAAGFGNVSIPNVHNSPARTGDNQINPVPCGACINNIARVLNPAGGVLATDDAEVCVGTQTPPCMLTTRDLKIDKKKIELEIKNNGAANVFLSEVALTWPQAINGNLVKITLNGEVWVGSASSPAVINSGFNADPNKRRIEDGQTKKLVLEFTNNASKVLTDYTGTFKFGADASCAITFPPATPPGPFDCDGHIRELKMRWNGTEPIKLVAHYGAVSSTILATIDNIAVGQVVTVSGYTGSPNDVIWEIFRAGTNTKLGESQFHTSCSDSAMDGPEDCGSAQGNGKNNIATFLNLWQFVGLTTIHGTTLLCP